jgi:anti-sigma factor RsiW
MEIPRDDDDPMTNGSSDDLACIELVELVTDYFEDALPPEDRLRLERHLGECEGCTLYIEQMRRTIEAAGRLAPEDVPPPALEPLLAAFRAYQRS